MNKILQHVNLYAAILAMALLLACEAKPTDKPAVSTSGQPMQADTTQSSEAAKKTRVYFSDTIYSSESLVILGDTNIQNPIEELYVKFEPYIGFSDFKVEKIHKGHFAPIQFESNPLAKEYKTRITEAHQSQKVNFGGHYVFLWWGCGSSCKSSAIIDVTTGKVFDGPTSETGYGFKDNSRLLIVNPPDSTGFYAANCLYCKPQIFIWNEGAEKFEERQPVRE